MSAMSGRLKIFVLIDALGWRLLQDRSFLSDLLPFRSPLRTVLGFSSGAIPTILTGVPPAENGHWNLFYYDPTGSPFRFLRWLSFLPDWATDNRAVRKLMKEMGRRLLGMGPMFECHVPPRLLPHFNFIERRCIYKPGGVSGASSIFDQLSDLGVPHRIYTYHQWPDSEILRRAHSDLKAGDARFYFLYLSEMDHVLHDHCSDSATLDDRLEWYGSQLRCLFQLALLQDPDATLAVFSDHGMAPVKQHYDLMKRVEALGLRMPDDYLAVYDSTMARFWLFSEAARRGVAHLLRDCPCGRVLPDEELRQLGVFFADRRYGEVIFLLHPGWMLARSDFNGPQWMPAGMHGYHPDDPDSDAVFLSNRPPGSTLQSIADVYQCMREEVA